MFLGGSVDVLSCSWWVVVVQEDMVGGVGDVGVLVVCFRAAVDSFGTAVFDAKRG